MSAQKTRLFARQAKEISGRRFPSNRNTGVTTTTTTTTAFSHSPSLSSHPLFPAHLTHPLFSSSVLSSPSILPSSSFLSSTPIHPSPTLLTSPRSVVGVRSYVTDSAYEPLHIPEHLDVLSFIDESLETFKDRPFVIDGHSGAVTTHGQFRRDAAAVGSALIKRGLGVGDVICIFAENSVEFLAAALGCIGAGGAASPVNCTLNAAELRVQLKATSSKFLFVSVELLEVAKSAVAGDELLKHVQIVVIGLPLSSSGVSTGITPYQVLVEDAGDAFPSAAARHQLISDPSSHVALLPFSSGTTGLPKGVQLTHLNLVANNLQISSHAELMGLIDDGSRDRVLGLLPMWHIYQLFCSLVWLRLGTTMVLLKRFEPLSFFQAIANHKLGLLPLVPPLILFLCKSPMVKDYDLSNVRDIVCAAAPLSEELQADVAKQFGIDRCRQGYGMTELSPIVTLGPTTQWRPGSGGVIVPNTRLKIVSAEEGSLGEDLAPGETGEIVVQGPQVMKGYLNNPKATLDMISADGWLHTGDVGRVEDGNLYVVDRVKELIKYKGHQVAPAELEALLLHHPAVADAAVIGIPDEIGGEVPRAFVVLKPGVSAEQEKIQHFVDERVNPLSKLRGGVELIDAVPKSASGKILRRELRDRFRKGK